MRFILFFDLNNVVAPIACIDCSECLVTNNPLVANIRRENLCLSKYEERIA